MAWDPLGQPFIHEGGTAAYPMSTAEVSEFASCPVKAGLRARGAIPTAAVANEPFDASIQSHLRAVVEALAARRGAGVDRALSAARMTYKSRPDLVLFLDKAAANYLDFLEAREAEVGPLHYRRYSLRTVVTADFEAKAWAPVYEREDGSAELHRLRYDRATGDVSEWAIGSAWVAARALGQRVTVVEVGLADGMDHTLVDHVNADDLRESFRTRVLPTLRSVHSDLEPIPCGDCSDCAAVAVCPALIRVDMFEGQTDVHPWVRSLSVTDLKVHSQCPRRWRLRSLKLPRDHHGSDELDRGRRIHETVARAHAGAAQCGPPYEHEDGLDEKDLLLLKAHDNNCSRDAVQPLTIEQTLVLWDSGANAVLYMKPDEMHLRDDVLTIREIKTTAKTHLGSDRTAARGEYHDVLAWALAAMNGGLLEHYGASRGVVELEVLTTEGGSIYTFESDGDETEMLIGSWLYGAPAQWLMDNEWPTYPSQACESCEWAKWCPEGAE